MEKDTGTNNYGNRSKANISSYETFYDSRKIAFSEINTSCEYSPKKVKTYKEMLEKIDYSEYIDSSSIVKNDIEQLNTNLNQLNILNDENFNQDEVDISIVKKKKKKKKSKKNDKLTNEKENLLKTDPNIPLIGFNDFKIPYHQNNAYFTGTVNNLPHFYPSFNQPLYNPLIYSNYVPIYIPYQIEEEKKPSKKIEKEEVIKSNDELNYNNEEFIISCNSSEGNLGIQQMIEKSNKVELESFLKLIKTNFDSIFFNTYGNHVIQKFIDIANPELVIKLKNKVKENISEMIFHINGIHILIKFCCKTNKFTFLKKYIKENFLECSQNNYSISLIQRILRNSKYLHFKVSLI